MAGSWFLTIKPSFLNESLALPAKEMAQVQKKLALLCEDPTPDAKVKKQLRHMGGKLHRLRAGDFRIFYTFEHPYVSVLGLRRRSEDTYDEDMDPELLGGASADLGGAEPPPETWKRWLDPAPARAQPATALPTSITSALLTSLRVPPEHHAALLALASAEEIIDCTGVPEDFRTRVLDALWPRPIAEASAQPDLVVTTPDDLLRYRDGELLGFLLKLDPEQEKVVAWSARGKGPTLLKGGPGTGKSTIALYRAKVLLETLRTEGVTEPRILLTTYTKALTRSSEQLLAQLLGKDAPSVEVHTADQLAVSIAGATGAPIATADDLRDALARALGKAAVTGNSLQILAQRQAVEKMERSYLLEEIQGVIEARPLPTLDDYLAAPRPGRKLALNKLQREAVWRVREALAAELAHLGKPTWEQLRARAADRAAHGDGPRYDAVIIDEAQDLQPAVLRMLVALCRHPSRLFLTADANQSIYGGAFRWTDIHENLAFRGRTSVLRANHRSTREIGEAARTYLATGRLDEEEDPPTYVHSGPLPAVRAVADTDAEAQLLKRFFESAARELRLGTGSCAVLCPSNPAAKRIASELATLGCHATYTTGDSLDLKSPGAKVMTLHSAKGLEFPIVALAGFLDAPHPRALRDQTGDAWDELLARERRTMFVGMTRAMRALLVVVPRDPGAILLQGFEPSRWNLGELRGS